MKKLLLVLAFLAMASPAWAQFKYNAMENRWEPAAPSDQLKYNAFENTWSYEAPNAVQQYNPYENRWQYAPPAQTPGQYVQPTWNPYGE